MIFDATNPVTAIDFGREESRSRST
jgi:hypothetical protein